MTAGAGPSQAHWIEVLISSDVGETAGRGYAVGLLHSIRWDRSGGQARQIQLARAPSGSYTARVLVTLLRAQPWYRSDGAGAAKPMAPSLFADAVRRDCPPGHVSPGSAATDAAGYVYVESNSAQACGDAGCVERSPGPRPISFPYSSERGAASSRAIRDR